MEAIGVDQEIRSTLNRRVDLPSGGYLIFDYAEAFTVIDVNTGRFVGSRSKKSGARLEDTITKNNLEAVKEVVRQLRLRDIGGIIVIDFIDMASPKNRAAVETALGEELERDRTKTYVVEISPLGLVEMTRQNVTDGPREVMTKKCPTCGGDGIVISEHTAAVDIERRLRSLVTPGSRDKAFKVEVSARVAWLVAGPGGVAAARARGDDEAALLPRRRRGRASRSPAGARPGNAREGRAEAPGRDRPGARAQARRGRPARSARRHRQGRRRRHRRRRRGQARRQEGHGRRSPLSRKGSPGPSCSRRPRRPTSRSRPRPRPRSRRAPGGARRARAAEAAEATRCRSGRRRRPIRKSSVAKRRPRARRGGRRRPSRPRATTRSPPSRRSGRGAARAAARTARRSRPPQRLPRTAASPPPAAQQLGGRESAGAELEPELDTGPQLEVPSATRRRRPERAGDPRPRPRSRRRRGRRRRCRTRPQEDASRLARGQEPPQEARRRCGGDRGARDVGGPRGASSDLEDCATRPSRSPRTRIQPRTATGTGATRR